LLRLLYAFASLGGHFPRNDLAAQGALQRLGDFQASPAFDPPDLEAHLAVFLDKDIYLVQFHDLAPQKRSSHPPEHQVDPAILGGFFLGHGKTLLLQLGAGDESARDNPTAMIENSPLFLPAATPAAQAGQRWGTKGAR
jgi:hypothetical protein